jgi:DNA-directed RNA polymerase II subunit RPB1
MSTSLDFKLKKREVKQKLSNETSNKTSKQAIGFLVSDDNNVETQKQKIDKLETLTIINSTISLYSWEQMKKIRIADITNSSLDDSTPNSGSVNDLRMGVATENFMSQKCSGCGLIDCTGHFGLIDFGEGNYIYNPAYIRLIVSILMCVCNSCGSLLISKDFFDSRGYGKLKLEKRISEMAKVCKKITNCLNRNNIKSDKSNFNILRCARNPVYHTNQVKENGFIQYSTLDDKKSKILHMPITTVRSILQCISAEDAKLLGFTGDSRPVDMILNGILVPPVIARPPVYEGNNIHYDQLTHKYKQIIDINRDLKTYPNNRDDCLSKLYSNIKSLIFKSDGNKIGTREFMSIIERIQGKTALLRAFLMGKRVDYCGRTVAGPDPSLYFGQIRLPQEWENILTKKIVINDTNKEDIIKLLTPDKDDKNKIKRYISKIDDTQTLNKNNLLWRKYNDQTLILKNGDVIERYLQDGDRVTVNRQPTLHKQSLMAYDVVLGKQSTIGLHLSYTSPMNCDFDGDENNVWVPQDFEVEAEAEILINVKANIMSAEQNKPIMGMVMNSVSGAFILSKGIILNKKVFNDLLNMRTNKDGDATFYDRLQKYNIHPHSGKALFSSLLPQDLFYNVGEVLIINGILIAGNLKKEHIGASHNSIIQILHKNYGVKRTVDFFTDAPRIINKWLMEYGFTVGMKDMYFTKTNDDGSISTSDDIITDEITKLKVKLVDLNSKQDDSTEEFYRQNKINGVLDVIKEIGLRISNNFFDVNNSLGIMTDKGSGAKGALVNIGQMIGSVGQQNYRGERLKATLTGGTRLLPIYDENDESPEAHAFIPESYFKGVSPSGLFFQQAGGREGLLDTALKTAETGSMQHKMIKAFENIVIGYDGSVRNTTGTLFNPIYNSGYDVAEMQKVSGSITSFVDIERIANQLNAKRGWVSQKNYDKIPKSSTLSSTASSFQPSSKSSSLSSTSSSFQPSTSSSFQPSAKLQELQNKLQELQKTQITGDIKMRKITKFEKARIIGTRANQLSNNDNIITGSIYNFDPVKIAESEYANGVLPLYIIRKYPDNSYEKVYPTLDNI